MSKLANELNVTVKKTSTPPPEKRRRGSYYRLAERLMNDPNEWHTLEGERDNLYKIYNAFFNRYTSLPVSKDKFEKRMENGILYIRYVP